MILFEPRTSRCVWILKVKQMFKVIVKQSHSCFWAGLQNCEKRLLVKSCLSVCLSVRPSVRMQQLSSHWQDFQKI